MMASTNINPATRRVLSPLNVNKPTTPRNIGILKGGETSSARGMGIITEASITAAEKCATTINTQNGISFKNRGSSDHEGDERPHKRARTQSPQASSEDKTGGLDAQVSALEDSLLCCSENQETSRSRVGEDSLLDIARSRSTSPSPASSFDSGIAALNDSQNTVLTEPEDIQTGRSPAPQPAVRRLTKEEAREKAEILKLRLRLASYRVFTNQITTPLTDLEIRTMPLSIHSISRSSQSQISVQPQLPNHEEYAQEHSKNTNIEPHIPSSPPAAYMTPKPSSPAKDAPTTAKVSNSALLFQHENDIVLPTLSFGMSVNSDDGDTSTEMKRSIATDGLLSLMRQQES